MASTTETVALEAQGLTIDYIVTRHRYTSLKEFVLATLAGRRVKSECFTALKDVSIQLRRGETLGLIGRNGSGKSTLLKTLAGIVTPRTGTVRRLGTITSLIELGAGFDGELTAEENVYLSCMLMGFDRKLISRNVDRIFEFAELEAFRKFPVKTFSSGMYARLGFACATLIDADIILIDEVLAVGDEAFQLKCLQHMQKLKDSGRSIVFVSHDLGTVQTFCDRVCVLDAGKLVHDGAAAEGVECLRSLLQRDSPNASLKNFSTQLKLKTYEYFDNGQGVDDFAIEYVIDKNLSAFPWKLQIFGFGQSKPLLLIRQAELEFLKTQDLATETKESGTIHGFIRIPSFPFQPGEFMLFLTVENEGEEVGHIARGFRFFAHKSEVNEERGILDIASCFRKPISQTLA
jgi:ABC-type polysaccharide/polyol phosphate transport system ATPase subunit